MSDAQKNFVTRKNVTMQITKGKGTWFCVIIGEKKFIMKQVPKFYWETAEKKENEKEMAPF